MIPLRLPTHKGYQAAILALSLVGTIVAVLALAQLGLPAVDRCGWNIFDFQQPIWLGCMIARHENVAGGLIGAGGALFGAWIAWQTVQTQVSVGRELHGKEAAEAREAFIEALRDPHIHLKKAIAICEELDTPEVRKLPVDRVADFLDELIAMQDLARSPILGELAVLMSPHDRARTSRILPPMRVGYDYVYRMLCDYKERPHALLIIHTALRNIEIWSQILAPDHPALQAPPGPFEGGTLKRHPRDTWPTAPENT